jgi:hypothetical protein
MKETRGEEASTKEFRLFSSQFSPTKNPCTRFSGDTQPKSMQHHFCRKKKGTEEEHVRRGVSETLSLRRADDGKQSRQEQQKYNEFLHGAFEARWFGGNVNQTNLIKGEPEKGRSSHQNSNNCFRGGKNFVERTRRNRKSK